MTHEETVGTLESIIDANGVAKTLRQIADICGLKADHIQSNWQDRLLASQWEGAAKEIERFSHKGHVWCL